ncbi:hypothetical protein PInf_023756 [Phytophthora infestans]|nr:hypothetical protein PInf_023756 [Phytophthora infestans]
MLRVHDNALLRSVSVLPVLMVAAIITLEYYVFMTEHWVKEFQRSVGFFVPLRILEAIIFHFVVGCMLVAYYKVVFTALSGPFQAALFSEDAPRGASNFSAMAVVGFVLGGALAISLLGFIAVHSYLLVHGATTIECHQYGRAFPFNQGWRKNFNDVFGDTTRDWLLPTTPARKQRYVLHPAELEHLTADSCFGDSSDQEDDSLL